MIGLVGLFLIGVFLFGVGVVLFGSLVVLLFVLGVGGWVVIVELLLSGELLREDMVVEGRFLGWFLMICVRFVVGGVVEWWVVW